MAFKRYAEAVWQGDLQSGKGAMSTPQSGLFSGQNYSFKTRFGDEKGTNPEELLAAAHAGCFSMALSAVLGKAGFTPDRIETRAEVAMDPGMDPGPTVTGVPYGSRDERQGDDGWRQVSRPRSREKARMSAFENPNSASGERMSCSRAACAPGR